MADAFDGFLELVPNQATMRVRIMGETQDSKQNAGEAPKGIQINSFTFGNASAIAAAQAERDAAKDKDEEDAEDAKKASDSSQKKPPAGEKTGKKDQDYRFQITKQLEASSPHLLTAFFSNSNKEKRAEHNSFSEAKLSVRKPGGKDNRPATYLVISFGNVSVVGYKMETQGSDPPTETVDFSFLTCEMRYKAQLADGTLDRANIKGWDFGTKKEKTA